jgi:TATA-binding protein-associated factor
MDTDQILDLMTLSTERSMTVTASKPTDALDAFGNVATPATAGSGAKAMLDGLQDVWDESQYQEEYNLDQFMKKLQS